jgi:RNA polymerase sigma factor (sigma-70 family)
MTGPEQNSVEQLLHRLNSADAGAAWAAFIDDYAGLIVRVASQFEFEQDRRNECFLHVCEKLCEDQFRRLLTFNTRGAATFSHWLSTVVFNLCVDWHRKEFGRARMLPAIAALPLFDQRVYQNCYEGGMSTDECHETMRTEIPGLAREQIRDALGRIHALLTPRQRWQLNVRNRRRSRHSLSPHPATVDRIPDPAPTPESLARSWQEITSLQEAMSRLTVTQRVLLQLRFREGLTYEAIARIEQLGNPHRSRRKVQEALGALRLELLRQTGSQKRQN